jgi:WD40 repeat protein
LIKIYDENKILVKNLTKFHSQRVKFLKYLSNGYVASSSNDGTVNIWNPNTWASIRVYNGHTDKLFGLDQIDSDTMLSGSQDGTVQIWKISTGETINSINVSTTVFSVRVLLNSNLIACGIDSRNDSLRIYNYITGDLVKTLYGHSSFVSTVEILNEKFIASASLDKFVIIWNLATYSIEHKLSGHNNAIYNMRLIPDYLLASTGFDYLIIIWNWLNGSRVFTLTGHTNKLWFCSLDLYNDQTLISGSFDKTIRLWNISNGTLIQTINTDIQIKALAMIKTSKFEYFYFFSKISCIEILRAFIFY